MKSSHILITRFPFESILSGEEWHTITLFEELQKRGYACSFMGSCKVFLKEFPRYNIATYPTWGGILPVSKSALILFFFMWPYITLSIWLQFFKIRKIQMITHVYMLSLTEKIVLTPLALFLNIPVLWVEHQRFGQWFYRNPLLFFYRLLAPYVNIITVSEEHKKQLLAARIPETRITVITNGIDTLFFSPHKKHEEHTISIGTVARLSHDKGVDILLHAFASLVQRHPSLPLRLIIQGAGPLQSLLEELAITLGVRGQTSFYTPYVEVPRDHMPQFYSMLSCFVLPSRLHDPFGLVAAEAMACGVPTIVTSACGISTQLTTELHALIIPPDDTIALTTAIEKLIGDHRYAQQLGKTGCTHAQQHFSLHMMTDQYQQFLSTSSH